MDREVRTSTLFTPTCPYLAPWFGETTYPWELLPQIKDRLRAWMEEGLSGFWKMGDGIWVGEGVRIAKTATLEGLILLGAGTEVRPNAYLRGNVITGEGCVIGNATEVKNAILSDHVQVPHYNYVGDSVLGNHAHMGAGAICSNLKADGRAVVVHGEKEYPTGLRKMGAMLGDGADIGCGCVLNPGTIVGRETSVYPLTSLRGVIPPRSIVKSRTEIALRIEKNG